MGTCQNKENCSCPKVECPNHGICCQCINNHRAGGNPIVFCMREKAQKIYGELKQ